MGKIIFSEKEMEVRDSFISMGTEVRERNTPVTPKENFEAMLRNEPHWQVSIYDYMYLFPKCVPDNPAKMPLFLHAKSAKMPLFLQHKKARMPLSLRNPQQG